MTKRTPLTRVERTAAALKRTETRIRILREQAERLEKQLREEAPDARQ